MGELKIAQDTGLVQLSDIQTDIDSAMGVCTSEKDVADAIEAIHKCDQSSINEVGSGVQRQISTAIQEITSKCRTMDCGEAGKALAELACATDIKLDAGWAERTFMSAKGRFNRFVVKYKAASDMLEEIVVRVNVSKEQLEGSFEELSALIEASKKAFAELDPLIKGLKICLTEKEIEGAKTVSNSLTQLKNTQELQSYRKRLSALEATQVVLYQTVRESMMLMITNKTLIGDMQDTVDNIVPLWQAQIITATNVEMQAQASKLNKQVHDAFNNMLIDNAKRINATADEIMSTSSDGLLRVETMKQVAGELDSLKEKLNNHYLQNAAQYSLSIGKLEELMEKGAGQ